MGDFIREARLVRGPRRPLGRHYHEEYALAVVHSGESDAWAFGGRRRVAEGDIVLVPPFLPHACNPDPGPAWSYSLFMLAPPWVESTLAWARAPEGILTARAPRREPRTPLAAGPETLVRDSLALLAAAAAAVVPGGAVPGIRGDAAADPGLLAAKSLMESRPWRKLTLDELAEASGLSKYRFIAAFKAAFGLSPHAYLLNERVNRAKRLLADGVKPAEAALECGFCDQSHLSRVCSRLSGSTPKEAAKARPQADVGARRPS
ncbi:MAG: AraC family transcriptional regulator [Spirochaetaceae bacterium]|nr:AraC family transcriptional regulator [Spirochaetaceae bacterium]